MNHELHHLHCCGSSPFCDPSENEFMANVWRNGCKIRTIVSVAALLPFLFQMVLAVAVAETIVRILQPFRHTLAINSFSEGSQKGDEPQQCK
jgi:hypothetical protein